MKLDKSFGIGSRSGKLKIKAVAYRKKTAWGSRIYYRCKCDCGVKKVYARGVLKRGGAISCGCLRGGKRKYRLNSHKYPLYRAWANMKNRCSNKNDRGYKNYGGRGISVCKEWIEFGPFENWALSNGYDERLCIDRVNTNGNYEPTNCRWITQAENNRNARSNIWITKFGEKKLFWDWIKDPRCTVKFNTVYQRMRKGFSREESLFSPVDRKRFR